MIVLGRVGDSLTHFFFLFCNVFKNKQLQENGMGYLKLCTIKPTFKCYQPKYTFDSYCIKFWRVSQNNDCKKLNINHSQVMLPTFRPSLHNFLKIQIARLIIDFLYRISYQQQKNSYSTQLAINCPACHISNI